MGDKGFVLSVLRINGSVLLMCKENNILFDIDIGLFMMRTVLLLVVMVNGEGGRAKFGLHILTSTRTTTGHSPNQAKETH